MRHVEWSQFDCMASPNHEVDLNSRKADYEGRRCGWKPNSIILAQSISSNLGHSLTC